VPTNCAARPCKLISAAPDSRDFWAALWEALVRKGRWQGEVQDRRKDGSVFIGWLSLSAISPRQGAASRYVATLYDITAHRASQAEIRHLAFFDPLTHLPNRRLLLERLTAALASTRRLNRPGALLFIDMDNFKGINDTRGHSAGDLMLVDVAARLQHSVRQGDTVARLGGDEFVVLLTELGANAAEATQQATQVARKALAALAVPYRIQDFAFSTSASIGITLITGEQTVSDLLQQSDLAMYEAKRAGRNTLCFFHAAMQAAATVHAEVEQELWRALELSQFELHYQPQFDAQQRVVAAEALLRWNHPAKGLVLPGAFIAAAEDTGLIVPIGRWVIETACRQLARWAGRPDTQHLALAVNVSARQFGQPDFVAHLSHTLQAEGADARLLTLELTETTVHDVDDIRLKMLALQNLGVRFSMDDFGIGHSSLARLIHLPVSQLKIDRSFVRDMTSSPAAAVVVHTIIGMARNLGMEVIAEGVETQAQLTELHLAGCPLFQGYLMSPAVPVAAFDARLQSATPAP
jgi:diguanylate cyclase (GGDEF)-like protein